MTTFSDDVSIDINSLDVEWERQSSVYHKCSIDYAEAVYEKDKKKFTLDVTKADLDSDIRKNPELYGLDKITEASVSNTIIACDAFKLATDNYIESNRDVNVLVAAKGALEHKKKALEKLTDLYLSGYWSEPKIKGDAKDEYVGRKSTESASSLKNNPRMLRRKAK